MGLSPVRLEFHGRLFSCGRVDASYWKSGVKVMLIKTARTLTVVSVTVSVLVAGVAAFGQDVATANRQTAGSVSPSLQVWVPTADFSSSALVRVARVFDQSPVTPAPPELRLSMVRNSQASAQIAIASSTLIHDLRVTAGPLHSDSGTKAVGDQPIVDIGYVGYMPVTTKPLATGSPNSLRVSPSDVGATGISSVHGVAMVADPIWRRISVNVPAHSVQPIWLTFKASRKTTPGVYRGLLRIDATGVRAKTYRLAIRVESPTLPQPGSTGLRFNVSLNPSALAVAYHVSPWSQKHWYWIRRYQRFLAGAGQSEIIVPIVDHPWKVTWNGWGPQTAVGYGSLVGWKYDGHDWTFTYQHLDKYVETALQAGIGPGIEAFSILSFRGPQWLSYTDTRTGKFVREKIEIGSATWTNAWCSFLTSFSNHMQSKGWLEHTHLAFDERPLPLLTQARDAVQRCAPALLDRLQASGSPGLSNSVSNLTVGVRFLERGDTGWVERRRAEGKITTFYTVTNDRHPNTLTFSPLSEARMMGWLVAKWNLSGFVHWAVNDWTADVYQHPMFAYTQGDEYLVYPGPDGVVPSVRWEELVEGMQDAELYSMAKAEAPASPLLEQALQLTTGSLNGNHIAPENFVRAEQDLVQILMSKR